MFPVINKLFGCQMDEGKIIVNILYVTGAWIIEIQRKFNLRIISGNISLYLNISLNFFKDCYNEGKKNMEHIIQYILLSREDLHWSTFFYGITLSAVNLTTKFELCIKQSRGPWIHKLMRYNLTFVK